MVTQTFQLVMQAGPTPGKTIPLEEEEIRIGRGADNDLVINDAEVSRHHARLIVQAGGYVLEDLGSTNGTFVNKQRLTALRPLHPGDTITIGENVRLVFEARVDPDATVVHTAGAVAAPPTVVQPRREKYTPPPHVPPLMAQSAEAMQAAQPDYTGEEISLPEEEQILGINRRWFIAGCSCLTLLLCVVVLGMLWYIDANYLWCRVFPFIPACP